VLAAMAVYPVAASRYVLPLAPAAVLLAFSGASPRALGSLRGDGAASLAVSLVLGVTLSVADFEAARISRDIAGHIGTTLEGWEEQTRFGGEWGFRYYMEAEGFRQFISTSDDVFGGQFVVTPMEAVPYAVGQDVASMLVPVGQRSWLPRIPILLMNRAAHAGFYSSGWGLLPFAFSHDRAEGVDVRQVNYLVERLPEITIEALDPVGEMIPRPAPAGIGGVELVVPPGTVRIPYEGPVPASVSFSCVLPEGNLGPCPIAVYHQVNQTRRELPLEQSRSIDESEGIDVSFEVNATTAGSIILEVNQVNTPQPGEVTIRNWRISPPGGAL
jgi:hypothetical protein